MPLLNGSHSVLWWKMEILKEFIHALAERLLGKLMPLRDLLHAFLRPANQTVAVEHHVQL
jgi:hypothetical protein